MGAALMATAVMLTVGGAHWVTSRARIETDLAVAEQAEKHARLLASALQKFRLLPLVLSEYPDAQDVLQGSGAGAVTRLNGKLELLADRTDAAAIYVIAPDGRTLAASNWREAGSFVGENFGYRPYFRNAMAHGEAELFAVGSVTGQPGFFIAQRIDDGARVLGVIVVKIDFGELEAQWEREGGHTMVADSHGVVIITGHDPWRFRATRSLAAGELSAIRGAMQFGSLPLTSLQIQPEASGDVRLEERGAVHRKASTDTVIEGATLSHFLPLEPARARAASQARLAIMAVLALLGCAFAIFWRLHMRQRVQARARQKLEAEVSLRTAELRQANERLRAESQRRLAADRRWRIAREELAQANRLGTIGQVTAGVAHEINQPMAAIRAFAENARRYIERDQIGRVRDNLGAIIDLTDRIGRITTELRSFARRRTPPIQDVTLSEAIDGALLLMGDRLRGQGVALDWRIPDEDVRVVADKIRLEQVLVNLLQNAAEALEDETDPRIAIGVETGETVIVTISDNGPGVAEDMARGLFTPFTTSKPDGLGLGLSIARDIAREFGGGLEPATSPLGGAAFRIILKRA